MTYVGFDRAYEQVTFSTVAKDIHNCLHFGCVPCLRACAMGLDELRIGRIQADFRIGKTHKLLLSMAIRHKYVRASAVLSNRAAADYCTNGVSRLQSVIETLESNHRTALATSISVCSRIEWQRPALAA